MNDIQDIILESEYNVLNSLYEYYNKQYIMDMNIIINNTSWNHIIWKMENSSQMPIHKKKI